MARCSGCRSSWSTAGRRRRGGGPTACCWHRWVGGLRRWVAMIRSRSCCWGCCAIIHVSACWTAAVLLAFPPSQALSPTLHLLPAAPPQAECRHGLPGTHAAASAARLLLPSCLSGAAGAAWRRQRRAGGRQQGGACSAGLHLQPHIAGQLLQPAGGGVAALLQVRGACMGDCAVLCCAGMLVHAEMADGGARAGAAHCVAVAAPLDPDCSPACHPAL